MVRGYGGSQTVGAKAAPRASGSNGASYLIYGMCERSGGRDPLERKVIFVESEADNIHVLLE